MSGLIDIPAGDPQAARIFSKYVFSGVQSAPGFMKLLSGPPPTLGENMPSMQTDTGTPIVKAIDTGKGKGDSIQFTLYNILTGKPVMGSKNLAGNFMTSTSSTKTVRVDQTRGGTFIDEMNRYRTVNDLRMVGLRGMRNWGIRLEDQRCLVHLAGGRGSQNFADWVVPLKSDADFASIMVNPVLAPTKNRRFIAGSAGHTTVASMTTADVLSLSDIGKLGAKLSKSNVPIMPVSYEADPYKWIRPLWVLFVDAEVWDLLKRPSAAVSWQGAVTAAMKRFDGSQQHPLFMGDSILWNRILVKPIDRYAVYWGPGETMIEDTGGTDGGTYTESTGTVPSTTNFYVHRSILVGAQALMKAYGDTGSDNYGYQWNEELTDHKDKLEMSIKLVEGTEKVRFRINNIDTDHGVAVIDSYCPPIESSEYATAYALS
jgi:hypothetical protein